MDDVMKIIRTISDQLEAMEEINSKFVFLRPSDATVVMDLLKKHELKRPGIAQDEKGIWLMCGQCGSHMKAMYPNDPSFYVLTNYCPYCGTKVKWDDD